MQKKQIMAWGLGVLALVLVTAGASALVTREIVDEKPAIEMSQDKRRNRQHSLPSLPVMTVTSSAKSLAALAAVSLETRSAAGQATLLPLSVARSVEQYWAANIFRLKTSPARNRRLKSPALAGLFPISFPSGR